MIATAIVATMLAANGGYVHENRSNIPWESEYARVIPQKSDRVGRKNNCSYPDSFVDGCRGGFRCCGRFCGPSDTTSAAVYCDGNLSGKWLRDWRLILL